MRNIIRLSLVKVEKVVKPPQKPVISSIRTISLPGAILLSHPNRKQPPTLAISVPAGHDVQGI